MILLGQNSFQHSRSYNIPFNNTIYQYLSKKNLYSLKKLQLNSLDLDSQQLPYLKNIKLPNIQSLNLNSNFITDDYFLNWITSQNMPKLNHLTFILNDITDKSIELIVKHNFTQLYNLDFSKNKRLTTNHLKYYSQINITKQKSFIFSYNSIVDSTFEQLFTNVSLQNGQYIIFQNLKQSYNVFKYFNWKTLNKIKQINFGISDVMQSIEYILQKNITLKSLKYLSFGGLWLQQKLLIRFINNLKIFAPNLNTLFIQPNDNIQQTFQINIPSIKLQNLPDNVYIHTKVMTLRKPTNHSKLQIVNVILTKSFFKNCFQLQKIKQIQNLQLSHIIKNNQLTTKVINYIKQFVYFDHIQRIEYQDVNSLLIFKYIVQNNVISQSKKYQYKTLNTYLPYLNIIIYNDIKQMNGILKKFFLQIDAPNVKQFSIPQTIEFQSSEKQFIHKYLEKYTNLMSIQITQSSLTCKQFGMIANLQLKYLKILLIQYNAIEINCLHNFLNKHKHIRLLNVNNNFMEKGLFNSIKSNQLILHQLYISQIQFGNGEFKIITQIQRSFIKALFANRINLNTQGIKLIVSQLKDQRLFPKIKSIELNYNNINEQGVKLLLNTGVPFLQQISFSQIQNPNLINNLLSYPAHLLKIVTVDVNIYGLNKNIDPRSTRNLNNLGIRSPSLQSQDYQILSKTNLINLFQVSIVLQNLFDCQTLKYILKIIQNAEIITININNQNIKGKQLNDYCLEKAQKNKIYLGHINYLIIQFHNQLAYIPKFYSYMYYQAQLVQVINLNNDLIGDTILLEIIQKCNLIKLKFVYLSKNLLTDNSVSQLLKINNSLAIRYLWLRNNLFSSKALKSMIGNTYQHLVFFDLSLNQINDEAISYLNQANFPNLRYLILDNTQLTIKGLIQIFNINAPQLLQISFANIKLSQKKIQILVHKIPFDKYPYLTIIITNLKVSKKFNAKIQMLIKKKTKKNILFLMEIHNLIENNVAMIN